MNEINILDKSIYNRIAAGEVVERPLSIVKELVENSIDAGATSISINIEDGGIKRISVSDNGKGISPEDVPTAFCAHATSKIKNIDDLDSISTLGFRGEALPSIAAVSIVKMNTRILGAETGYTYTINNGEVVDSGICGCPFGTNVTVTNLFDKIPARKKFLAKLSVEESAITGTVAKLMLANYLISFKYSVDGKVIYQSSGQSKEDAIYAVYGKEFSEGMLEVASEYSDIKLSGFICKPSASKHSKSFQTLIVNGRYVKNEDVSFWLYGCYMNYLMKRQYPAYILYVNLPFDLVDVNVHPNKLEIKFANENLVKKIITDAVKEKLLHWLTNPTDINDDIIKTTQEKPLFSDAEKINIPDTVIFDSSILGDIVSKKIFTDHSPISKLNDSNGSNDSFEKFNSTVADISYSDTKDDSNSDFIKKINGELKKDIESSQNININKRVETTINDPTYKQNRIETAPEIRYVGKLFNTYLVYEYGDDSFFIDQHAAHERILFDKLCLQYESGSVYSQQMLVPYTFNVLGEENVLFTEALPLLDKYGFHFEKYGDDSFSLKSVPSECAEMDLSDFADKLINNVLTKSNLSKADILRDKLAQYACKAAIKGGMDIPSLEIEELLKEMLTDGRILVCPHGRPVIIKVSRIDIEKWFKRIV